jgi:hypothetical protein
MLPLLETFLELLIWNIFQCCRHVFWMSSVSWNLCPFKILHFWKQPEVMRSQIRGLGWVFHFNKRFLARNCLTACELENYSRAYNHWARVQAFFYAQLHVTTSVFPFSKLGSCVAFRNEFEVNNTLDVEESDDFDLLACLDQGVVVYFHWKLSHLLSGSCWKHHVLSSIIFFFCILS